MREPVAFSAGERFDVRERRVLITGAAHGLGLAMATAFAGAGAQVALLDVDEDGLEAAHAEHFDDGSATAIACDVSDEAQVAGALDTAVSALGGIDAVINSAAVYPVKPLATAPPDHLAEVFDVNVGGYARVVRAAHSALLESGRGRVVNLSSITFFLGFPDGLGAYVASKGAVIGLTRALARELGPAGITVNSIAPGAFPTRAETIIEDRTAYDQQILDAQCVKRRGEVSDIACAALFLASDAASFVTGQTLVVDGGWVFG
jgi:NAD(P)-dependent dehydrogenase (short-subunit alcohol dehydrogenase family)